jgi:hypothetical protein
MADAILFGTIHPRLAENARLAQETNLQVCSASWQNVARLVLECAGWLLLCSIDH